MSDTDDDVVELNEEPHYNVAKLQELRGYAPFIRNVVKTFKNKMGNAQCQKLQQLINILEENMEPAVFFARFRGRTFDKIVAAITNLKIKYGWLLNSTNTKDVIEIDDDEQPSGIVKAKIEIDEMGANMPSMVTTPVITTDGGRFDQAVSPERTQSPIVIDPSLDAIPKPSPPPTVEFQRRSNLKTVVKFKPALDKIEEMTVNLKYKDGSLRDSTDTDIIEIVDDEQPNSIDLISASAAVIAKRDDTNNRATRSPTITPITIMDYAPPVDRSPSPPPPPPRYKNVNGAALRDPRLNRGSHNGPRGAGQPGQTLNAVPEGGPRQGSGQCQPSWQTANNSYGYNDNQNGNCKSNPNGCQAIVKANKEDDDKRAKWPSMVTTPIITTDGGRFDQAVSPERKGTAETSKASLAVILSPIRSPTITPITTMDYAPPVDRSPSPPPPPPRYKNVNGAALRDPRLNRGSHNGPRGAGQPGQTLNAVPEGGSRQGSGQCQPSWQTVNNTFGYNDNQNGKCNPNGWSSGTQNVYCNNNPLGWNYGNQNVCCNNNPLGWNYGSLNGNWNISGKNDNCDRNSIPSDWNCNNINSNYLHQNNPNFGCNRSAYKNLISFGGGSGGCGEPRGPGGGGPSGSQKGGGSTVARAYREHLAAKARKQRQLKEAEKQRQLEEDERAMASIESDNVRLDTSYRDVETTGLNKPLSFKIPKTTNTDKDNVKETDKEKEDEKEENEKEKSKESEALERETDIRVQKADRAEKWYNENNKKSKKSEIDKNKKSNSADKSNTKESKGMEKESEKYKTKKPQALERDTLIRVQNADRADKSNTKKGKDDRNLPHKTHTDNVANEVFMSILLDSTEDELSEAERSRSKAQGKNKLRTKSVSGNKTEDRQREAVHIENETINIENISDEEALLKVPKIKVVLAPTPHVLTAEPKLQRIMGRRKSTMPVASKPLVDKQKLFGRGSLSYEDLVDHNLEQHELQVNVEPAQEPVRLPRYLATLYEKTDDNCNLSYHNIIDGKRRSRLNKLSLNEEDLSWNAFIAAKQLANTTPAKQRGTRRIMNRKSRSQSRSSSVSNGCQVRVARCAQIERLLKGQKFERVKNVNPEWHSLSSVLTTCVVCAQPIKLGYIHYMQRHGEHYGARLPPGGLEDLRAGHNIRPIYRTDITTTKFYHKCVFCHKQLELACNRWVDHFATHTGEFNYQCSNCKMHMKHPQVGKQHVAACGSNARLLYLCNFKSNSPVLIYVCRLCNLIQLGRANLKRHLQQHHGVSEPTEEDLHQRLTLFRTDNVPLVRSKTAAMKLIRQHNAVEMQRSETDGQAKAKKLSKSKTSPKKRDRKAKKLVKAEHIEENESSLRTAEQSEQVASVVGGMGMPQFLPDEEPLLVINECKLEQSEEENIPTLPEPNTQSSEETGVLETQIEAEDTQIIPKLEETSDVEELPDPVPDPIAVQEETSIIETPSEPVMTKIRVRRFTGDRLASGPEPEPSRQLESQSQPRNPTLVAQPHEPSQQEQKVVYLPATPQIVTPIPAVTNYKTGLDLEINHVLSLAQAHVPSEINKSIEYGTESPILINQREQRPHLIPDRFRCMALNCNYCADTVMCIRKHMKIHSLHFGPKDYLQCAYCDHVSKDVNEYVLHGVLEHGLASTPLSSLSRIMLLGNNPSKAQAQPVLQPRPSITNGQTSFTGFSVAAAPVAGANRTPATAVTAAEPSKPAHFLKSITKRRSIYVEPESLISHFDSTMAKRPCLPHQD